MRGPSEAEPPLSPDPGSGPGERGPNEALPQAPTPPPPVTTGRFLQLFSAVMLPMFLAAVDQTLLATATPAIARELGGLRDTTWIAIGYLIAMTVTAPIYGRLGDRYGRRDVLMVALSIFAAGSALCGLASTLGMLVGARVLQGLGGGGLMVMSQALIGELVPPRERARFQGWFATNFSLASIGGPVIGGLVVHHASWRWLFLVNLPLCALAVWRLSGLPRQRQAAAGPLGDALGALLFAVAAGTTLVWISFAGHRFDWWSGQSATLAALATCLWCLLAMRESRHQAPFLPVELLRVAPIARMAAAVVCFASCLFAVIFFLPIFLQLGRGTDARAAGLLLIPVTMGMVLGSTATGRITARTGLPVRMPVIGLSIAAVALALLALAPPAGTQGIAALGLLCGVGFGTVMPTAQLVTQSLAGRERLGAAAVVVTLARATGAALGTAVFGAVIFAWLPAGAGQVAAQAAADPEFGAQVRLAFRLGFGAAALVAAVGAWTASRVGRVQL